MNVKEYQTVIETNPYYNFTEKPMGQVLMKREEAGKEGPFYLLCGVIFFFALIRVIFYKYLQNLFAVFFRVSMKQKQLREQLLQAPLPSLLLNLLFIMSGGIYVSYLMNYYHVMTQANEWMLVLYCTLALLVIYIVKLAVLKITGWIFNMREATDTYIFIVFLVNKLLGICLLPLLLFMAFSDPEIVSIVITLSFVMVVIIFSYRYIISYVTIRKEIKVSPFHFILYLCAFEMIPILLIYKGLLEYVYRRP